MEENNQNKEHKNDFSWEKVSQFLKTPRGKGIAFFAIYLVFFIALSILARVSGTGDVIGSNLSANPYSYNMSSIHAGNYNFSYRYLIDRKTTTYSGSRNDDVSTFSDGVTQYYQKDTLFMKNQNGVWIKCDSPYIFSFLFNSKTIEKILDSSTYVSKTELATGEEAINFQITTTTLVKLLDGEDVDLDDPVNTIQLKKDKDGEIVEIQYDISSYAIYKGQATNQFMLTLSYSDFGKVEKITEPV